MCPAEFHGWAIYDDNSHVLPKIWGGERDLPCALKIGVGQWVKL